MPTCELDADLPRLPCGHLGVPTRDIAIQGKLPLFQFITFTDCSDLQGRRNRGARGPLAPPDFSRFSVVVVWPNAQASQGLLALAPPEYCTFRRPWCFPGCSFQYLFLNVIQLPASKRPNTIIAKSCICKVFIMKLIWRTTWLICKD